MDDKWTTLAEAAVTLNCSVRTIQRRISEGNLETRRRPDGKAEVRLGVTGDAGMSDNDGQETTRQATTERPTLSDTESDTALAVAVSAWNHATGQADQEIRRVRRWGLAGWATAAVLAITGGVGIWWTTKSITQQQARGDQLAGKLTDTQEAAAARAADLVEQIGVERSRADTLSDTRQKLEAARADLAGVRAKLTEQATAPPAPSAPEAPNGDQAEQGDTVAVAVP